MVTSGSAGGRPPAWAVTARDPASARWYGGWRGPGRAGHPQAKPAARETLLQARVAARHLASSHAANVNRAASSALVNYSNPLQVSPFLPATLLTFRLDLCRAVVPSPGRPWLVADADPSDCSHPSLGHQLISIYMIYHYACVLKIAATGG